MLIGDVYISLISEKNSLMYAIIHVLNTYIYRCKQKCTGFDLNGNKYKYCSQ